MRERDGVFTAGLRNFTAVYRQNVDYWQWFDNSGAGAVLLDEGGGP